MSHLKEQFFWFLRVPGPGITFVGFRARFIISFHLLLFPYLPFLVPTTTVSHSC